MKTIIPLNPIYLFVSLFVPWNYANTYCKITGDNLLISRYYAQKFGKLKVRKDYVDLRQLVAYGFPSDLNTKIMEPIIKGKGIYVSQEIQFLLNDHTRIPWNVRPYNRAQIKKLADYIYDVYAIMPCSKLGKAIGFGIYS